MTQQEILNNSISTDLKMLREDVDAGLYENNELEGLKEAKRIADKMTKLHEIETLEEEAERIKGETAYEEIEDQEFKWGERREEPQNWAEEHGAFQGEDGEWIV